MVLLQGWICEAGVSHSGGGHGVAAELDMRGWCESQWWWSWCCCRAGYARLV